MTEWEAKKVNHWHVCRDGKRFATVDDEETANDIIRICTQEEVK